MDEKIPLHRNTSKSCSITSSFPCHWAPVVLWMNSFFGWLSTVSSVLSGFWGSLTQIMHLGTFWDICPHIHMTSCPSWGTEDNCKTFHFNPSPRHRHILQLHSKQLFLTVCVCVCIMCMYVYMCIMCVCMNVYVCVYVYMCTCVCVWVCVCMYLCICMCMYCVYVCVICGAVGQWPCTL